LHKDGEHSQVHWGKYNPNLPFHWGIWLNFVFSLQVAQEKHPKQPSSSFSWVASKMNQLVQGLDLL